MTAQLNSENFLENVLSFEDREAGVSIIFDPETERYSYNAYCLETKLLKELLAYEFSDLEEALTYINNEFSTWELKSLVVNDKAGGCGSCAAK